MFHLLLALIFLITLSAKRIFSAPKKKNSFQKNVRVVSKIDRAINEYFFELMLIFKLMVKLNVLSFVVFEMLTFSKMIWQNGKLAYILNYCVIKDTFEMENY